MVVLQMYTVVGGTNMLSDSDKRRIIEEEEFRSTIRERAGGFSSRLWKFLNSAFGIWLLGTVTLGALTAAFTSYVEARAARRVAAETRERVRSELDTRFEVAEYYLELQVAPLHQDLATDRTAADSTLSDLILDEANGVHGVADPDFRGTPAVALFARLKHAGEPSNSPLAISAEQWMYLEPKLRLRTANGTSQATISELNRRILTILKGLASDSEDTPKR